MAFFSGQYPFPSVEYGCQLTAFLSTTDALGFRLKIWCLLNPILMYADLELVAPQHYAIGIQLWHAVTRRWKNTIISLYVPRGGVKAAMLRRTV
jgi:hypothetical protein